MPSADKAYFCPTCGSPSLNFTPLGSEASCRTCGWEGPNGELAVSKFEHDFGTSDEVAQVFAREVRALFTKQVATSFALFLHKWGFLPADKGAQAVSLARYFNAISRAVLENVIKERERQEKESHRVQ